MKYTIIQWSLIVLGWIWVALAVLGIFLPLLPTTPFLLLASACFMRGSPKMEAWLKNHPKFGPILRDWQQQGAIDKKVKRRAAFFIVASFTLSIVLVPEIWHKGMLFLMASVLLFWFLRLPEPQDVAGSVENT